MARNRIDRQRKQRPQLIIFVEGETEKGYVEAYKRDKGYGFIVKIARDKLIPDIITEARNENYDEHIKVICVFDCDRCKRNEDDNRDLILALSEQVKEESIVLIRSLPCFELWLLSHFQDISNSPVDCDYIGSKLKEHIFYKKGLIGGREFYNIHKDKFERAIRWSKRNCQMCKCPSTNMHELFEEIEKFYLENPRR